MATGESSPETKLPEIDLGPLGPKARYEFTADQEKVVSDLAGKMGFVGGLYLILAIIIVGRIVFAAVSLHKFDVFATVFAVVFGLIGYWTMSAANGFSAVVNTVGWDVVHLMDALRSLRKLYALLYYLFATMIVVLLVLGFTYGVR